MVWDYSKHAVLWVSVCIHTHRTRLPLVLLTDLIWSDRGPYAHIHKPLGLLKSRKVIYFYLVPTKSLFRTLGPPYNPQTIRIFCSGIICLSLWSSVFHRVLSALPLAVRARDGNVSRALLFTVPKLSITFHRPDINSQNHTGVSLILSRIWSLSRARVK